MPIRNKRYYWWANTEQALLRAGQYRTSLNTGRPIPKKRYYGRANTEQALLSTGQYRRSVRYAPAIEQALLRAGQYRTSVRYAPAIEQALLRAGQYQTSIITGGPIPKKRSRTGPKTEHLTILCAATHETELADHDFCLSRSHYTDTDPTSRERAAPVGIEPGTSSPGVVRSTNWATPPPSGGGGGGFGAQNEIIFFHIHFFRHLRLRHQFEIAAYDEKQLRRRRRRSGPTVQLFNDMT